MSETVQDFGRLDTNTWQPLTLLNFYRFSLALILLLFPMMDTRQVLTESIPPQIQQATALVYLLFSLAVFAGIHYRWPRFAIQVYLHVVTDILVMSWLIHASGNIDGNFGILMVVAVAGGSLLMAGKSALIFSALGALLVLSQQIYGEMRELDIHSNISDAGLLGIALFATAILAQTLGRRIRESEALAKERGSELASMEELTDYIIQRMQTGILVVDKDDRIRLANESVVALLNLGDHSIVGTNLTQISPELATQKSLWQENSLESHEAIKPLVTASEVMPRFARLSQSHLSGTLIFLEDMVATAQQAQQIKLASLGRLTASIAHEIRNPLGAISHAAQLLDENQAIPDKDSRLIEIIHRHSARMDKIIGNVLRISRREPNRPEMLSIEPWLKQFLQEFTRENNLRKGLVLLQIQPTNTHIRIDPSQLRQILWNLCKNALSHSNNVESRPRIEIHFGTLSEGSTQILDIRDFGPGIDAKIRDQIFEPFFTTAKNGTGLGLYIARELCEINQVRLNLVPLPGVGCCFRMTFPDPRRKQVR